MRIDHRLDDIDKKLDSVLAALTKHQVKSEGRISRLETVQKGFITILGTALASFATVVVYLMTGGAKG